MEQKEIEQQYSRKNIRTRVMMDINPEHEVFKAMVKEITKYRSGNYYISKQERISKLVLTSQDIASELLTVILPIKEVSPVQSLATQLGAQLGFTQLLDAVKTAAELIAVCEISKAYTIYHSGDFENRTGTLGVRPNFSLEDHTADFITQTKYLPPMITPPVEWKDNGHGGYLEGTGSVILGSVNHHNEQQSLDVINILQNISWSLNGVVDYVETPNKELDSHDKKLQFLDMIGESTQVYTDLMNQGNKFYFVWKYDKRGRMYSQGYHCNLQGTEYKKAILNFAKQELIQ